MLVFIAAALKAFKDKVTPYEKEEILEYPEVWFLGLEAKKIEAVPGASQNSGFDDENGNYIKMLYDHLAYRYEILEVIGKGSFGQVVKVCNRVTVRVNLLLVGAVTITVTVTVDLFALYRHWITKPTRTLP